MYKQKLPQIFEKTRVNLTVIVDNPYDETNIYEKNRSVSIRDHDQKKRIAKQNHRFISQPTQVESSLASLKPNAFLKYDSSILNAELKAHDKRRFLLNRKISQPKNGSRRQLSEYQIPQFEQMNEEEHRQLIINLSTDTIEDQEPIQLPINKIALTTKYNGLLARSENSNDSLINVYSGEIKNYPKVYHYLEDTRFRNKDKLDRLLMPERLYEHDGRKIQKTRFSDDQDAEVTFNTPNAKTSTKLTPQITVKKKKGKINKTQEELINHFIEKQLNITENKVKLQKAVDRYNYNKMNCKDYRKIPYDPSYKKILEYQANIINTIDRRISPANQQKLKKNFKDIYQNMVFGNRVKIQTNP